MQLICEQCQASYTIADKLLVGRKPFRIQCRRCKNSIQVGGVAGEESPDGDIPIEHDLGAHPPEVAGEAEALNEESLLFAKAAPRTSIVAPRAATSPAPGASVDADPKVLESLDQFAKSSGPRKPRRQDNVSGIIDVYRSITSVGRRTRSSTLGTPVLHPDALPDAMLDTIPDSSPNTGDSASWKSVVYTVLLVVAIVSGGAALSFWMLRGGLTGAAPERGAATAP